MPWHSAPEDMRAAYDSVWRPGPQAPELLYAPIPSTTQKGHGYVMKMRPIYVAGVSGKQIVTTSYYSLAFKNMV